MTVYQTMKNTKKKIPGILPPPPKTEFDGKITDLSSKTIPELLELRDRQVKLLTNKAFVNKLADKGAKMQTFHDKIVKELVSKQQEEQTCRLFDQLNLNKQFVQQVEWEGKIGNKARMHLDSDDDSDPEDVLHILSKTTPQEKQIKVLPAEKPLVTPENLLKIGELPHIKYIVEKTETNAKPITTGEFKPYKTTRSDSQNPEKEKTRKKHKNWEVTAATPPPSIFGPAKALPLEESLKLQKEYNYHIKEIEAQHAAEKLLSRAGIRMGELPVNTAMLGGYREPVSEDSDDSDPEGSDKEVHDEETERGGVIFTVMK